MRRAFVLAALAVLPSGAQQDYRVRVSVDLVQVDATVTDAQGHPATGLKAADFRILLDGKPQELQFSNYIPLAAASESTPVMATGTAQRPATPAAPMKREHVRRTIVLFVADLLTSAESMPGIRAGLRKFVQEQMQPGDLAAVVRSSAGLGALQDFTPDRSRLMAAVEQVGWTPHAISTGGASAYETIGQPALAGFGPLDLAQAEKIDAIERATLATTASLLKVIHGMAGLPGRKSVILLSDALRLTNPDEMDPTGDMANGSGAFLSPIYESIRRVVDESVRAGVVLYAIDTRGTASLRATASDRLTPPVSTAADAAWNQTEGRRSEYRDSQSGASFVSSQTGGFMITESNRIDVSLQRILADQQGYYLLGFKPPAEAMQPDGKGQFAFHKLKVEVLRPGLKVRSHAGFFGVSDRERRTVSKPELQLSDSLESPFQASEVGLDVETSYLSVKNDFFIRATLFIDGKDLALEGPPVHRTGVLHVILRVFNATGDALAGGIDQVRRIDLNEEGYERARKFGLIYTALLPVPKSGPYQVRAACRDQATGHIGTAGDFVSIPRSKGKGIRLSGIVFQHALGTDDHVVPATASRLYSAGQTAPFAFQITSEGPQPNPARLTMRTRLFRDGVEVWSGAALPVASDTRKTASFFTRGSLEVPGTLAPGRYQLRVDVGDREHADTVNAWQWARLTIQ